ncbi:MAG: ribosome maturation factor RimM [Pseudomonadota bacterium]
MWVTLGKVGAPFGVSGWAHVYPVTVEQEALLSFKTWRLKHPSGAACMVSYEDGRKHQKALVAKLSEFDSPETLRPWVGADIEILREDLPPIEDDDFYWIDLIGLAVYNADQDHLGLVSEIYDNGAHGVMVCSVGAESHAIPLAMGDVILKVDQNAKTILVDWPNLLNGPPAQPDDDV